MHTKFLSVILKGTDQSENLGVGAKAVLEWIFGKEGGMVWTHM